MELERQNICPITFTSHVWHLKGKFSINLPYLPYYPSIPTPQPPGSPASQSPLTTECWGFLSTGRAQRWSGEHRSVGIFRRVVKCSGMSFISTSDLTYTISGYTNVRLERNESMVIFFWDRIRVSFHINVPKRFYRNCLSVLSFYIILLVFIRTS